MNDEDSIDEEAIKEFERNTSYEEFNREDLIIKSHEISVTNQERGISHENIRKRFPSVKKEHNNPDN